jgi:ATP-dependent Clp protease adaptor protein ClpS
VQFLTNLRAAFNALREPVALPKPLYPEASSELELLRKLLADPALASSLSALGLQQSEVVNRLATSSSEVPRGSDRALLQVRASELTAASSGATGTLGTSPLREESLLGFLITRGSAATRKAMEQAGMPTESVLFWLAHREHESMLLAKWPTDFPNGARLAMLNDQYTPMELVVSGLRELFDLPEDEAIQLMIRVHKEGEVHRDIPSGSTPVETCIKFNMRWRSIPVPLYIRPVAV